MIILTNLCIFWVDKLKQTSLFFKVISPILKKIKKIKNNIIHATL